MRLSPNRLSTQKAVISPGRSIIVWRGARSIAGRSRWVISSKVRTLGSLQSLVQKPLCSFTTRLKHSPLGSYNRNHSGAVCTLCHLRVLKDIRHQYGIWMGLVLRMILYSMQNCLRSSSSTDGSLFSSPLSSVFSTSYMWLSHPIHIAPSSTQSQ